MVYKTDLYDKFIKIQKTNEQHEGIMSELLDKIWEIIESTFDEPDKIYWDIQVNTNPLEFTLEHGWGSITESKLTDLKEAFYQYEFVLEKVSDCSTAKKVKGLMYYFVHKNDLE